jgi:hypothetical protein
MEQSRFETSACSLFCDQDLSSLQATFRKAASAASRVSSARSRRGPAPHAITLRYRRHLPSARRRPREQDRAAASQSDGDVYRDFSVERHWDRDRADDEARRGEQESHARSASCESLRHKQEDITKTKQNDAAEILRFQPSRRAAQRPFVHAIGDFNSE